MRPPWHLPACHWFTINKCYCTKKCIIQEFFFFFYHTYMVCPIQMNRSSHFLLNPIRTSLFSMNSENVHFSNGCRLLKWVVAWFYFFLRKKSGVITSRAPGTPLIIETSQASDANFLILGNKELAGCYFSECISKASSHFVSVKTSEILAYLFNNH